jgi:hypothetical protein
MPVGMVGGPWNPMNRSPSREDDVIGSGLPKEMGVDVQIILAPSSVISTSTRGTEVPQG